MAFRNVRSSGGILGRRGPRAGDVLVPTVKKPRLSGEIESGDEVTVVDLSVWVTDVVVGSPSHSECGCRRDGWRRQDRTCSARVPVENVIALFENRESLYQGASEARIFNSFKRRWDATTLDRWHRLDVPDDSSVSTPGIASNAERRSPVIKKRYNMWSKPSVDLPSQTFEDLRIKEDFDIVVGCPDSEPAVLDLQECIEWTGQRDQLQNAFLAAVDKRLMHPGAETTELYISTIKISPGTWSFGRHAGMYFRSNWKIPESEGKVQWSP
ncbi:MAG: hypothetical protein J3Q66DRAFT_370967 [Benniella sp.]|nr:MAG: hypothetical protein J3Q66DRAFT_370967 [Benniella sp.]